MTFPNYTQNHKYTFCEHRFCKQANIILANLLSRYPSLLNEFVWCKAELNCKMLLALYAVKIHIKISCCYFKLHDGALIKDLLLKKKSVYKKRSTSWNVGIYLTHEGAGILCWIKLSDFGHNRILKCIPATWLVKNKFEVRCYKKRSTTWSWGIHRLETKIYLKEVH